MSNSTLGKYVDLSKSACVKKIEGGCYCGALRYVAKGESVLKAQCHCRECQYFSGGGPNFFMLMPLAGFEYVLGAPTYFRRSDIDGAVTRVFCGECGTHTSSRRPGVDEEIVKVGTLDDPGIFVSAKIAVFARERQSFHHIADSTRCFEGLP